MQNNRRQFLGSLARGLLLPIGGGALTLADPAKAAGLQITQGPLPLSGDAVRLRFLKRDLRRMYETQGDFATVAAYSLAYQHLMADEVRLLETRILERPARSWTDVVELAEVAWWSIAHRGDRYGDPASVLTKAVLTLGGGERFYLHDEGKPDRPKTFWMP